MVFVNAIPPSVLPDISPTRGENASWLALRFKSGVGYSATGINELEARALHPLSPLVGEMSGRTEGGAPTC